MDDKKPQPATPTSNIVDTTGNWFIHYKVNLLGESSGVFAQEQTDQKSNNNMQNRFS